MDSNILPNFIYQLEVPSSVLTTFEGQADGILYWFEVESGASLYNSKSEETLARCTVYLFDKCINVISGQKVEFKTSLFHGNLVIEIV